MWVGLQLFGNFLVNILFFSFIFWYLGFLSCVVEGFWQPEYTTGHLVLSLIEEKFILQLNQVNDDRDL